MTDDEYRYAEKVLYSYKRNVETSERMSEELRRLRASGDVHGQSYEQIARCGSGDPVARHVDEIMRLEARLKSILRRIKAVDEMRKDLREGNVITITKPKNLLLILDGYYIPCLTVNEFLSINCWSRSIFYIRRRELVMITGEYLRA